MSLFELAIPIILRREGGFVNDAADPGGATNFGVSLRWLQAQGLLDELEQEEGDVTHDAVQAVKLMTPDEAKAFYRKFWWDAYHYGNIIAQAVATKVFDMSVNLGAPRAHRLLQIALAVPSDGVIGPATLAKANSANSILLINDLQQEQAGFYRDLVAKNPARQKFLAGWLNRAFDKC